MKGLGCGGRHSAPRRRAGGNAKGRLAISLTWAVRHDLDLHVMTPSGEELHFGRRQVAGGELDVDMCAQGPRHTHNARRPVENVVWPENPPLGNYRIFVRNSTTCGPAASTMRRDSRAVRVLVRIRASISYSKPVHKGNVGPISDVRVYEFTLNPGLVACHVRSNTHGRGVRGEGSIGGAAATAPYWIPSAAPGDGRR